MSQVEVHSASRKISLQALDPAYHGQAHVGYELTRLLQTLDIQGKDWETIKIEGVAEKISEESEGPDFLNLRVSFRTEASRTRKKS